MVFIARRPLHSHLFKASSQTLSPSPRQSAANLTTSGGVLLSLQRKLASTSTSAVAFTSCYIAKEPTFPKETVREAPYPCRNSLFILSKPLCFPETEAAAAPKSDWLVGLRQRNERDRDIIESNPKDKVAESSETARIFVFESQLQCFCNCRRYHPR